MLKVNFGCGRNVLTGWENHDYEVDIRKKLPYESDSVDFILAEHVLEHVSIREGIQFLQECFRILKDDGVVRICIPCVEKIYHGASEQYLDYVARHYRGERCRENAVFDIIFNYGHQTAYTMEMLEVLMRCVGFKVEQAPCGASPHRELCGIDGHGKRIGEAANASVTGVMEGTKVNSNNLLPNPSGL